MLSIESNFYANKKLKQNQTETYNRLNNQSTNLNITNEANIANQLNIDNNNNIDNLESEIIYTESSNNNNNNNNLETNITIDFEHENQINATNNKANEINSAINLSNNQNLKRIDNYNYSNFRQNEFPINNRKYGNTFAMLNYGKAPLIVIGPNWPYFLGLTLFLFLSFFAVFITLGNNLNSLVRLIGIIIYLLQFISYTACSILNPGLADNRFLENPNFKYDEKKSSPCSECKLLININTTEITYHCFECEVCIEGYDHHCPWTTKCIGKKNIWLFYIFVTSTFAYIICLFIAISLIQ